MTLIGITITGADDGVDPAELVALSLEFPFVEWGILFSKSREAQPRYPSGGWLNKLVVLARSDDRVRLAAHFCGQYTHATVAGNPQHVVDLSFCFRRLQLNGWWGASDPLGLEGTRKSWMEALCTLKKVRDQRKAIEFILQVNSEAALRPSRQIAFMLANASLLFDPSGGKGISPTSWPLLESSGVPLGYAGGITGQNIESVISERNRLEEAASRTTRSHVARPYWLDMESGVRTNDSFDLGLVREVLERARPHVLHVGAR